MFDKLDITQEVNVMFDFKYKAFFVHYIDIIEKKLKPKMIEQTIYKFNPATYSLDLVKQNIVIYSKRGIEDLRKYVFTSKYDEYELVSIPLKRILTYCKYYLSLNQLEYKSALCYEMVDEYYDFIEPLFISEKTFNIRYDYRVKLFSEKGFIFRINVAKNAYHGKKYSFNIAKHYLR